MKVVLAGSRRLPTGLAPRLVVRFMCALEEDTVIMLRRPVADAPGPFERDVAALADVLRLTVEWCRPEPTEETPGRASVYARDYSMAERADLVLLFITEDDLELGVSGTSHLQDAALQADRPCYAYAVANSGEVSRIGEYDPDSLYAEMVPLA